MSLQIIVDSGSDILPNEAKELGITHLPLKVVFGDDEFEDAVNLTHKDFYEKLIESDTLPTTCQITPAAYEAAITSAIEAGNDVLIITLSSKLSGTYQSACIAAENFGNRVEVVDSLNATLGIRVLVQLATAMRDEGKNIHEIAAVLNEEKKKIRLLALLDTLEYLKKGGRISKAVAFAGTMLSIKPVVTVADGEVVLVGKARGSRQGNNLLRELVLQRGIDFSKPLCLAYSGLSDTLLQKYIEDSADLWQHQTQNLPVATVGCAIGTHVGPGAVAVAFFEK
ncbi:MAG: DegV family protein [Oscillospiraceae bacterium]|nr:DegV family protein [Oscillospiraceae bacterium]